MKRTLLVLIAVLALTVGAVTASSAPRDDSDAGASAVAPPPPPKPGRYTYVHSGVKHPVRITHRGRRITVTFRFFKHSPQCARTMKFPDMKFTHSKTHPRRFFASEEKTIPKNSDENDPDAGGGTASVRGEVNKRTLDYHFNFSITTDNYYGVSQCYEFPSVSGKLKRVRR